MHIIEKKAIAWKKIYEPKHTIDFPCMLCRSDLATIRIKCQMEDSIVQLVVCQKCANLTPTEILDRIKD